MSIFNHLDIDDDELEVRTHIGYPNDLYFDIARGYDNVNSSVRVDRDAVLRLHAALGEWLYPAHTPEWANKSLIEQMIEKAVKDQVAAVLPLHLKPGDRMLVADADGRVWAGPEPHDVGHAEEPAVPYQAPLHLSTVATCRANHCDGARHLEDRPAAWPDPEPHDVGHAEEPEGVHRPQDCPGQPECAEGEPKPDHGRLMSELPVRTRPRPVCVSCGHGWGEHTSGVCWGGPEFGAVCDCTRERPGPVPAPCTCDMQHSHRPVIRNSSPATCAYRDCECKYRSTP